MSRTRTRTSGKAATTAGAITIAALVLSAGEARALIWTNEIADAAPSHIAGIESSLVIDVAGRPRVAYTEVIDGTLKFGHKTSTGAWVLEVVDSAGEAGSGVSLALDSGGNAHVVYFRSADSVSMGDLVYARRSCFLADLFCSWTKTVLAAGVHSPFAAGNASLAFDSTGILHVAYLDDAHGQLKYVRKDSTGWSSPFSVTPVSSGEVSIAGDASGLPHIAFSDNATGAQRYAHIVCFFILCGFSEETIDSGNFGVLRLDPGGHPAVGYMQGGDLRFARRPCDPTASSCAWTSELVAAPGPAAGPSLAIAPSGIVHMSFERTTFADVQYARRSVAGVWTVERADLLGSTFGTTWIALDGSGNPHISHHDHFNDDLRLSNGAPRVVFPPIFELPPGGGVLAP